MEKPEVLYHGSPQNDIEVFEPRVSKGSGEQYGPLVYATPDLTTAIIFTSSVNYPWSSGRFGDVSYVIIPLTREDFIKQDKGGTVYVFSSETFTTDEHRGLSKLEWASAVPVIPIKKMRIDSSLEAMIEHGVQVYFVDEKTFEKLKQLKGPEKIPTFKGLKSENQLRGVNVRIF